MRSLLVPLALVSLLVSCDEAEEARDTRAIEAYCGRLEDPQIAEPLRPAIGIAARARAHEGDATTAFCDGLSEALTRANAFSHGFNQAAHVASVASDELVLGVYFEAILPNQTEAEVACRNGDFDRLDELLETMRAQAQTAVERATTRCDALLSETTRNES